jgi:fructose-bisphosphate aldolase class I
LFAADWQNFISGVILYEETLNQKASNGTPFAELLTKKGVLPGIKVDKVGVILPVVMLLS